MSIRALEQIIQLIRWLYCIVRFFIYFCNYCSQIFNIVTLLLSTTVLHCYNPYFASTKNGLIPYRPLYKMVYDTKGFRAALFLVFSLNNA